MSIKEAEAYIQNVVDKSLRDTGYTSLRERLNLGNTQLLDISYSTFKINNDLSQYKSSPETLLYNYRIFIALIKANLGVNRRFSDINKAGNAVLESELAKSRCILIQSGDSATLIGYTYRDIRDLLTVVANSPQLINSNFGTSTRVKVDPETGEILSESTKRYSILELGHTGEQTPFAEKIKLVIANSKDSTLTSSLQASLSELLSIQADIGYTYLNTSNNEQLGSGIVRLVVQPRSINARFSEAESKVYAKVLNAIQYSLKVENIPGSNTLLEDATQFAVDRVLTKLTGVKQSNVKKHEPIEGKIKLPNTKVNASITSYSTPIKTPDIRTVSGQFYSLASLQQLLDDNLQHVVAANMGSGGNKGILNYQTGRFAASVKVERLSQSREGMITAYYNYMKNPYQTFEPGYQQGSPKTRDPKLLIAKSIRELAASKVGNRLRAVLV